MTSLYLVTTCAFIYLVPAGAVTSAPEFARRAGEAIAGRPGPSIFAAIVVLSVAVSMLALLVMAPRVYVAMSDDGLFPRALGALNQTTKTPVKATALTATLASLLVVLGTFQQIVAFFICTGSVFIALAAAAVFVVRRRARLSPFRVPGYPYASALFILLIVVVSRSGGGQQPLQAGAGIALLLLGLPAHGFFASRAARPERLSRGVHP